MASLAASAIWLICAQRDSGTVAAHLYKNIVNINGTIIVVCTLWHL